VHGYGCAEDGDDDAYIRDPDWLKDLETAAAIAELHNAVEASPAYEDSGTYIRDSVASR